MDGLDRLICLREVGLWSEGLGPPTEWKPVPADIFQQRHSRYWHIVAGMIKDEPGDYDDLPDFMTETATDLLADNDN